MPPEVDPTHHLENHNAERILTSHAKKGPAGWEEAGPSIIPLSHVPDEGEWRFVQTARGNRKGPEPPQKKRLRVVVGRECYLSSFALLGGVAT